MNVGSKCPIACNNSRHVASWRFYLHRRIEETSSPGIVCIVHHQVLSHQSEYETSLIRKYLLAKGHIAKWNELTESEVSELTSTTSHDTALAILKTQSSRGVAIVSSQRKFIFVS